MQCGLCGFHIIKLQTALHNAMRCTITYGAVMPFCGRFLQFVRFGEHPYWQLCSF